MLSAWPQVRRIDRGHSLALVPPFAPSVLNWRWSIKKAESTCPTLGSGVFIFDLSCRLYFRSPTPFKQRSPHERTIGASWGCDMLLRKLWSNDEGQDIAEYAVMLAVILVLVVGTVRLIGSNANNAFSSVASSLQ